MRTKKQLKLFPQKIVILALILPGHRSNLSPEGGVRSFRSFESGFQNAWNQRPRDFEKYVKRPCMKSKRNVGVVSFNCLGMAVATFLRTRS